MEGHTGYYFLEENIEGHLKGELIYLSGAIDPPKARKAQLFELIEYKAPRKIISLSAKGIDIFAIRGYPVITYFDSSIKVTFFSLLAIAIILLILNSST